MLSTATVPKGPLLVHGAHRWGDLSPRKAVSEPDWTPTELGVLASALWKPLGHLRASDLISRAEKMQPPHGWRERIISKVPESQTAQRGLRQGVSNPAGEASMAGTQEPTGSSLPSCAFFRSHLRCHLLQTMCCLLAKKQPSLSSSNVHASPQHG